MKKDDKFFMKKAIELAKKAGQQGEVPVGCVIVKNNIVLGEGYNKTLTSKSPFAHAEIIAMENAASSIGDWRFIDSTIFVTLEPCLMCAGAILNSHFERVVYGARNLDSGVLGGVVNVFHMDLKKHTPKIKAGVLEEECQSILLDFFKEIRK